MFTVAEMVARQVAARVARLVENDVWKGAPLGTTFRIIESLVRKRADRLCEPVVGFDRGRSSITADLRTANGLALFRYGMNDPDLDLIRMLLRPGDVFVDAGANIGLFSLVGAASVGPEGAVYAFEPVPTSAVRLRANAELNQYSWLNVRQAALAESTGTEALVAFEGTMSGFSSFAPSDLAGGVIFETDVVALDQVIPGEEWHRVRLIKVDVEGAERRVIAGAAGLLSAVGPDVLIEVEAGHLARQGSSVEELQQLFEPLGYRTYSVHRIEENGVLLRQCAWDAPKTSANLLVSRSLVRAQAHGVVIQAT